MISSRWVSQLDLHYFRNYSHLSLTLDARPVVLTGPNGAGKTNILESLSYLSSGKGLRKAKLSELRNKSTEQDWVVHMCLGLEDDREDAQVGVGVERQLEEDQRVIKVNQAFVGLATLKDWLSVLWQTPQMDFLFCETPSVRRKFFDKLVSEHIPEYAKHLYRYTQALRERSRLLKGQSLHGKWLDILEETLAQESMAIYSFRQAYMESLKPFCHNLALFPQVELSMEGQFESFAQNQAALIVEDKMTGYLKESRKQDAVTGGASIGAHHTHVRLFHVDQQKFIEICSTGEQKALLLSLVMANCRLRAYTSGRSPLLLLDEVVAHLDQRRREALFEEIKLLKVQAWMTGTDAATFDLLGQEVQHFKVFDGNVLLKN